MKSKLLPILFLLLLFILLGYFAHPLTRQLKIIAGIVMALGVIALIVAARIEEKERLSRTFLGTSDSLVSSLWQ